MQKSPYHSAYRKLMLASYSQSYDPTIYTTLKPSIAKAKVFLEELEKKIGHKISWTLYFTKVVAQVFENKECNQTIKLGLHAERRGTDFSILVDIGGGKVNL